MNIIANLTIDNKLNTEKRAVSVYHHATQGAHLISHNSSITIPLKPVTEEDYLHISVIRGPGRLKKDCLLNLPIDLDFEFTGEGKIFITRKGNRLWVKIPAGPPIWQVKLTRPSGPPIDYSSIGGDDNISIGEI